MQIERRGLLPLPPLPPLALLALLALSAAFAPVHAQSITPALKGCMTVPDGQRRLACYDLEMRRITGAASISSTPSASMSSRSSVPAGSPPAAPASPPAASPTASPQKQFGLPPTADRERRLPSRITARVASATRQASGRYIITLENGEVWLQTEDDLGFAPRRGSAISIKRGVLNSYWMRDRYYVVAVRRLR